MNATTRCRSCRFLLVQSSYIGVDLILQTDLSLLSCSCRSLRKLICCRPKPNELLGMIGWKENDRILSRSKTNSKLLVSLKIVHEKNPQIKQSIENTRSDQTSNLIPHDKDHANDPRVLSRSFTVSQTNR
jgi:hypothetical protein